MAALALLPASLKVLEISTRCSGPLPTALARFSQLLQLHITGDGSSVDWQARGAAAVLPKLRTLRLEAWGEPQWDMPDDMPPSVYMEALPAGCHGALVAATALRCLEVVACWSGETAQLVQALPSLNRLGLDVVHCSPSDAGAVAALLGQLPPGTEVSLAIHALHSEPGRINWDHEEDAEEVRVPPLAGLAAAVTELRLAGKAWLPPDWRQLTALRCLSLSHSLLSEAEQTEMWGVEPLLTLTALRALVLNDTGLPESALLATAPALERISCLDLGLDARRSFNSWRAELAALRPDVVID